MEAKMMNVGSKMGGMKPMAMEEMHYPSFHVSNVKDMDMETGEIEFMAKGKVRSVTEREGKYSYEIEVHSICPYEEGDIKSAFDKISSKKSKKMDEYEDE
jgi:hypothetical protein